MEEAKNLITLPEKDSNVKKNRHNEMLAGDFYC